MTERGTERALVTEPVAAPPGRQVPGTLLAAGIGLFALVLAYFAFGMPGMQHGAPTAEPEGYELADADAFAKLTEASSAFVVNVHVPFEGEIADTDEHIAADRLASSDALPRDRRASILVYCKTGSMSADAAEALVAAGYTNVTVLRGGMDAWEASGGTLLGVD